MNTNDLIENLARGLEPVAPLWRPGARAAMWLLGAVAYVGVLVVGMGAVKGDSSRCRRGVLDIADRCSCRGAAGKPSSVRLRDSRLTIACARVGGVGGARLARDARCSVILELRLGERRGREPRVAMRRLHCHRRHAPHARSDGDATSWCPLEPAATAAFAALAVAAMANVGACLSLPHANSAITVVWHGGVVLALACVAAFTGQFVFAWKVAR